jgi:hypothetical protein
MKARIELALDEMTFSLAHNEPSADFEGCELHVHAEKIRMGSEADAPHEPALCANIMFDVGTECIGGFMVVGREQIELLMRFCELTLKAFEGGRL